MKTIIQLFYLSLLFISNALFGQATEETKTPKKRPSFYITWGYHRDAYSRSNLKLKDNKTDDYNFTLFHAKAHDRLDMENFLSRPLTVPQYVLYGGFFFNDKHDLGIEIGWDHLKYIVKDNQMMHMEGTIRGIYYNQDTLVTPSFVHVEHTNGNNYLMVNLIKRCTFIESKSGYLKVSAISKFGAGALIPKSDSYIMGNHNDGPFRLSGFVWGASIGARIDLLKYFYIEADIKGASAHYTGAKLYGKGRLAHQFFSLQYITAVGFNFPL